MVNRRAFFEIFFYNRENRSREMMEAAESVWRAYMKKYGLGLDAGIDGQPTYDEVREITYLANAAIEAVEKQIAEAEAEEARRKKIQKEAWDLGIFVPVDTATDELEALVMKALNKQTEEAAAESVEEAAEETVEEAEEEVTEEAVEEVAEEVPQEVTEEAPVQEIPVVEKVAEVPRAPVKQVSRAGMSRDLGLWVEELIGWCQDKGMQCITTVDEGDVYLHVYQPHRAVAVAVEAGRRSHARGFGKILVVGASDVRELKQVTEVVDERQILDSGGNGPGTGHGIAEHRIVVKTCAFIAEGGALPAGIDVRHTFRTVVRVAVVA